MDLKTRSRLRSWLAKLLTPPDYAAIAAMSVEESRSVNRITRARLRLLVIILVPVVGAIAAILYVVHTPGGSGARPVDLAVSLEPHQGRPNGQRVWMERLHQDREALFYAPMAAQVPRPISVDQRYQLTVKLKAPAITGSIADEASAIASRVLVGGTVGVSLHCFLLSCTAITPARQEVNPGGGTVTWEWSVEAKSPGAAQIYATVTTYDQATSETLYVNDPRIISINVASTWPYKLEHLANGLYALIAVVGFSTILAGGTWLWRHRPKRKADEPAEKDGQPEPDAAEA